MTPLTSTELDEMVRAMWEARCRYFGEPITELYDETRQRLFEEYVFAAYKLFVRKHTNDQT